MSKLETLGSALLHVVSPDIAIFTAQKAEYILHHGRKKTTFITGNVIKGVIIGIIGFTAEISPYMATYIAMKATGIDITPVNMLSQPVVVGTAMMAFSVKTMLNYLARHTKSL